jgi:hypothetical protein
MQLYNNYIRKLLYAKARTVKLNYKRKFADLEKTIMEHRMSERLHIQDREYKKIKKDLEIIYMNNINTIRNHNNIPPTITNTIPPNTLPPTLPITLDTTNTIPPSSSYTTIPPYTNIDNTLSQMMNDTSIDEDPSQAP